MGDKFGYDGYQSVLTFWKKYTYHYHGPAACRCVDGESDSARACFPLALSPMVSISPCSPRFFDTMHAFSTAPSFRFQTVVYRVEIEKCVSLDSVQKRREADDNFKFTEYVVMEIILLFSIFKSIFP